MRDWLRRRLTYANVVASLALFLALGGVGYAITLPSNSVGTAQLKRRAVTNSRLATNSVTARNVVKNTIGTRELGPFQVRSRNYGPITFRTASVVVPAAPPGANAVSTRAVSRNCNAGEKAVSAGTRWSNAAGQSLPDNTNVATVEVNYQSRTGFGVFGATARGANATNAAQTFTIQVQCLSN
jgi:hypothetical protein